MDLQLVMDESSTPPPEPVNHTDEYTGKVVITTSSGNISLTPPEHLTPKVVSPEKESAQTATPQEVATLDSTSAQLGAVIAANISDDQTVSDRFRAAVKRVAASNRSQVSPPFTAEVQLANAEKPTTSGETGAEPDKQSAEGENMVSGSGQTVAELEKGAKSTDVEDGQADGTPPIVYLYPAVNSPDSTKPHLDTPQVSLVEKNDLEWRPQSGGHLTKKVSMSSTRFQSHKLLSFKQRSSVQINFENLSYTVAEGSCWQRNTGRKTILHNLKGSFHSGQLVGIMGPSGAGKSSFMNIMAGYRDAGREGEIYVNDSLRDSRRFRKLSCYIMQDDRLYPHLTVYEAMMVSANLKLSNRTKKQTKKELIDDILGTLGLLTCAKTRTSSLSGGQRKRLAIALELVNNPPVMFFDEPTSGLDSLSSSQCIALLRALAHDGRIIICTIHQPSAKLFEMFDRLYILGKGECIYDGTVTALVPFLRDQGLHCPQYHNPADYLIEVASGEYGDVIGQLVQAVNEGKCEYFDHKCRLTTRKPSSVPASIRRSRDVMDALYIQEGDTFRLVDNEDDIRRSQKLDSVRFSHDTSASVSPEGDKARLSQAYDVTDSSVSQSSEERIRYTNEIPRKSILSKVSGKDSEVVETELAKDFTEVEHIQDFEPIMLREMHTAQCTYFNTSFFGQFSVLFKRTLISIMRDTTLTHLRFFAHIAIALILGALYWQIGNDASKVQSNAGLIFFSLLFIMFASLMPTVLTFPLEMPIFVREHLNYWYSIKSYFFAKTFADFPFQVTFPIVYCIIIWFMSGQPNDSPRLVYFCIIFVMLALVAQSFGLMVGATSTSMEVATFVAPISTIPLMLFSGFFVKLTDTPVYLVWLQYISYMRYGFEGCLLVVYGTDRPDLRCTDANAGLIGVCNRNSTAILENLDVQFDHWGYDALILTIYFFVFRFASYIILRLRVKCEVN